MEQTVPKESNQAETALESRIPKEKKKKKKAESAQKLEVSKELVAGKRKSSEKAEKLAEKPAKKKKYGKQVVEESDSSERTLSEAEPQSETIIAESVSPEIKAKLKKRKLIKKRELIRSKKVPAEKRLLVNSSEDEAAPVITKKYKRRQMNLYQRIMSRGRITTPSYKISVTTQKSPSPDKEDDNAETQQDQNQQERVVVEDYVSSPSNHDQDMGGGMDQAEDFQQDLVAEENDQGDSAVEKIQQEELQHPTVQQEIVETSDEEDDVVIPEEDLEQLELDLNKFTDWKRIRNLPLIDQTEAVNSDPERLRDLEIWALEFCKDIPYTEFCYKFSNPHLRRLEKFKYNQLRTKVLAKEQAARDEAEKVLKSFMGSINKEAMFLMQDDEDTGIKSKFDGMSESEILKAKKKEHPAEPETVEKQQERSPARPEIDETEQAMSLARKERVDEATETSITPFKSAKTAKAQQILSKIKNPVPMKKKHFPSGNAALDKIHKELKKTRKGQKKVLAENAEVKQEQSKVSETLTQLLGLVQQLAEDNKVLKAKQESAERKLGEISLKQQETAPQEIHDLSDSEFDQSEPEDAPAKSSQAEKRKAIPTEKEVEAKRRKASQKISKSRKAKEDAEKEAEERAS